MSPLDPMTLSLPMADSPSSFATVERSSVGTPDPSKAKAYSNQQQQLWNTYMQEEGNGNDYEEYKFKLATDLVHIMMV